MLSTRRANPRHSSNLLRRARTPSSRAPRASDVLTPLARELHDPEYDAKVVIIREGIVEGMSLSGRAFISLGEQIMQNTPLRVVRLVGVTPFLGALARCPHLARLDRLDLSGNRIGPQGMKLLAASPFLGSLCELVLNGNELGRDGFEALCNTTWAENLRRLELADNGLDAACANDLSQFPRLTALDLSRNHFGRLPRLPAGLRWLNLSGCELNTLPVPEIGWESLTHLDLSFNPLGNEPATGSLIPRLPPNLIRLDLSFTELNSLGAAALGRMPNVDTLEVMNLRGNHIATEGAAQLANTAWDALVELDLGTNPIGDDGAIDLIRGDSLSSLERLSLANCGLTDAGVRRLAATGALGGLRELSLAWNAIGDDGVTAVAGCPDLAGLQQLDLTGTHIGFAGALALVESQQFRGLRTLILGENHRLTADAVTLLRERYNSGTE